VTGKVGVEDEFYEGADVNRNPAMTTVLEVAHPECADEVLADEVVVLNVETGIYFSMRGLAAALWRDLAAGHRVEELAHHADEQGYGAQRVTEFVSELIRRGLMRPSSHPPAAGVLSSAALLQAGSAELIFEVYEDMQDLILSDPIHDVDESMGWPHRTAEHA
jgi:hypothetical protein